MDQEGSESIGEVAPAGPKAEWSRPEADRMVAGAAEASAGLDVEGLDGLS